MRGSGGGGGKVWTPSKISRYMGKSRSKPTPAPEEISWFRALGWGGGKLFHWNALIRTDCLMKDQARGGGGVGGDSIPARGLGLAENDGFHVA